MFSLCLETGTCKPYKQQQSNCDKWWNGLWKDNPSHTVHLGRLHRAREGLDVQDRVYAAQEDQRYLRKCRFDKHANLVLGIIFIPSKPEEKLLPYTKYWDENVHLLGLGSTGELMNWVDSLLDYVKLRSGKTPNEQMGAVHLSTALPSRVATQNGEIKMSVQPAVDSEDGFLCVCFQSPWILLQVTIVSIYTNAIFCKFWSLVEYQHCKSYSSPNLIMAFICYFNGFEHCKCELR